MSFPAFVSLVLALWGTFLIIAGLVEAGVVLLALGLGSAFLAWRWR